MPETGFYTLTEVAAEFRVSPSALYKIIDAELLHPYKQGRKKVYSSEEVKRVVAAFKQEDESFIQLIRNREQHNL